MAVAITEVKISKNPVNVNEQFKISVTVEEVEPLPLAYVLSFTLGDDMKKETISKVKS